MDYCDHDHEEDNPSKWDRFFDWFNRTTVPANFVALALTLIVIAIYVSRSNYDWWFATSVGLALWSVWDIVKWRRRKQVQKVQTAKAPIGPDDDEEFIRSI